MKVWLFTGFLNEAGPAPYLIEKYIDKILMLNQQDKSTITQKKQATSTLVLGLGCDRGTPIDTVETAITQALDSADLCLEQVEKLASIDKKQDEVAFIQLAKKYALPMQFYSAEQLASIPVPSPSAVVMKYVGTPSVSEAAAILAANTDMTDLLVEKHKYRGEDGKNATVSIVRMRANT